MKKGDRIRHKERGFEAKVLEVGTSVAPKPLMVRLVRDDMPHHPCWFVAKNFEVIPEPSPDDTHIYYLVSSVVKIDVKKEGWDAGCDECFGIQKICAASGYDSLSNKDEIGVRVIGYSMINQRKFNELKYDLFTEEGGI